MALQWRETLSPKASLSFGYVRRDDAKADNSVWQLQGETRSAGWEGRWSYARSQDKSRSGKREKVSTGEHWNLKGGYAKSGFRAGLRYGQTSPGFVVRNGLVSSTDVREMSARLSYGREWKAGPVRQLGVSTVAYRATRPDKSFYRRNQTHSLAARTAGGLNLRLSYRAEQFQQYRDHVTSVGLIWPASGPFQNLGLRYSFGTRRGSAYQFLSPVVSCRLGGKLAMSASSQLVRHSKNSDLETLALNYNLGNRQSLGIRVEHRNNDTRWLLAFRQNGQGSI